MTSQYHKRDGQVYIGMCVYVLYTCRSPSPDIRQKRSTGALVVEIFEIAFCGVTLLSGVGLEGMEGGLRNHFCDRFTRFKRSPRYRSANEEIDCDGRRGTFGRFGRSVSADGTRWREVLCLMLGKCYETYVCMVFITVTHRRNYT